MTTPCNNKNRCHKPVTIGQDMCAMRVGCSECKNVYVIRIDSRKNAPENRSYSKVFKRDLLQAGTNLYYKYYKGAMNVN